jgi:hypothetical protein
MDCVWVSTDSHRFYPKIQAETLTQKPLANMRSLGAFSNLIASYVSKNLIKCYLSIYPKSTTSKPIDSFQAFSHTFFFCIDNVF